MEDGRNIPGKERRKTHFVESIVGVNASPTNATVYKKVSLTG
mgnify:CR=1 FL=1